MARLVLLVLGFVLSINANNIQFTVEEKILNTLIGNIGDASGLKNNFTADEYSSVKYKFLDQSVMQTRFRITESGDLFTSATVILNRETLCGFGDNCILNFDVAAYSNMISLFKILSVDVVLLDANDNSPLFPSNEVTLTILESAIVGSTFNIPAAEDSDSTQMNTVQSYHLVPENYEMFGLNVSKISGTTTLKLVLSQTLDRETLDHYQFKIIAKDGGNQPNTGTLTVNVVVKDYNDNAPSFNQDSYAISVNEGAGIGHSVMRLTANDDDLNENAKVSYHFNSRQSDLTTINNLFELTSDTGDIKVAGNLVYEEGKVYKLVIDAKDQGEPSRTGTATVLVSVRDIGNNPPSISISFLSPGTQTSASLPESSNLKMVIAHVSVVDTDSGDNGKVTCSISSVDFGLQPMPSKGYIVIVNRTLDREKKDKYDITITCSDHGSPVMETSMKFNVTITDENDNKPVFEEDIYYAFVEENGGIGLPIKQVIATDDDLNRNSDVYYFLDSDAEGRFEINSNTGKITTHASFDRETRLKYNFTVLAVDSGNPPLTGSAMVILTVTDKNDHSPEFDIDSFQFFVPENSNPDTYVGTLNAVDKDEGDNKKIIFSIKQTTEKLPFVVFPNGVIQTTTVLDREKMPKYTFHIVATDMGTPALSSSTRVVVQVTDENDNSPVISFPKINNNTVSVSFLAEVGSVVARVKASDLDEEGPNSRLTYGIVSGNPLDIFNIGTTTGNVFLKRTYPIEEDMPFRLKISVRDSGLGPRETFENLNIILRYSNETVASQVVETSNTNIIITIVVVILTIIISSVIIVTICVLRRHDKRLEESKDSEKSFEKHEERATLEKIENGYLASMDSPKKKRKEVSFSLDEAYDSYNQDFTSSMGSTNVFTEIPKVHFHNKYKIIFFNENYKLFI